MCFKFLNVLNLEWIIYLSYKTLVMKNLLLVAFTLLTICIYGCSQKEVEPPTAVVAAFQQMFPDAGNVRWELKKNGDYEANFKW